MPAGLLSINTEHQGTSTQEWWQDLTSLCREQQEPSCWDVVKAECQTGLICLMPHIIKYQSHQMMI